LYPPIHAFVYFPLAMMKPQPAYRVAQVANLVFLFLAALACRFLARGRVWWPVAAVFLMAFPGFPGSLSLGQNSALSLAVLTWGWVLVACGLPFAGGLVWGLLAFKPVWAVSFFSIMVLARRWRVCLGMITMGLSLIGLTLPVVGVHSWLHWLQVGRTATGTYDWDENWIVLSRDLMGIPRRWLLNFQVEGSDRVPFPLLTRALGLALVVFVVEVTVRMVVTRPRRAAQAVTGPAAAFLGLTGWLLCFHFIYYDMLLAAFPVFLLLTEPRSYLLSRFYLVVPASGSDLGGKLASYYRPAVPLALPPTPLPIVPAYRHIWVVNSGTLHLVGLLLLIPYLSIHYGIGGKFGTPWETFCLMALWLWCAWRWLREGQRETDRNAIALPARAEQPVELAIKGAVP
jgi:hypothetical protein